MAQFLGSANGTDFGPDLRTRTVHIHFFFASIPVLQVLHFLCERVHKHACPRALTRRRARQRANTWARAGAPARAARGAPQPCQHTQRVC